jgi:hypothetical protein
MSKDLNSLVVAGSVTNKEVAKTTLSATKSKLRFDISGFYFIGLFALIIIGFWPSYFARFIDGTADFTFYFHFHAAVMILWIFMLIAQPILIRKKKLQLHRLVGKASYFLFPLMCISIILIIHQSHTVDERNLGNTLLGQSKNLFIFITGYVIAIRYRHNIDVHARGMIVTGIALIEPALTRLMLNIFAALKLFVTSPNFFWYASIPTIIIIFSFFIGMMIKERRQKRGRWVFPVTLGLYFILYLLMITNVYLGLWESFSKWFISLQLT